MAKIKGWLLAARRTVVELMAPKSWPKSNPVQAPSGTIHPTAKPAMVRSMLLGCRPQCTPTSTICRHVTIRTSTNCHASRLQEWYGWSSHHQNNLHLLLFFSGAHKLLFYSLSVCQSVLQQLQLWMDSETVENERANLNKRSPEGDRCSCLIIAGVRLVI